MNNQTVSVIIPTYNRASLIHTAIDSVLTQTYPNVELIVVDDGSTDNTKDVIAATYGNRVRYIVQANAGAATARNNGIRNATGEFISFLDSDDLLLPEKIARQVDYLNSHPDVDIALCGWRDVWEGSDKTADFPTLGSEDILFEILLSGNSGLFPPHIALLRKRCFDLGVFDDGLLMREEQEFWLRLSVSKLRFGMIEEILCIYNNRPSGKGKDWRKLEQTMPILLDRVFKHPEVPAHIQAMEKEFRARSHISFALYYYKQGESGLEAAHTHMKKVFQAPANFSQWRDDTFDTIVYEAITCAPDQPEQWLKRMCDQLLKDVNQGDWLRTHLQFRLHVIRAFQAYNGGRGGDVRHHVYRAALVKPSVLKNRGVSSIFLKSLFKNSSHDG